MSAPWPIGPERQPRRDHRTGDRLAAVDARLASAEAQMAALEARPDLARAFLRAFGRGFLVVLGLFILLLV